MTTTPDLNEVARLADLLEMLQTFPSHDQRARYLLCSNWMRDHDAQVLINAFASRR
jgi:hypothetical protein